MTSVSGLFVFWLVCGFILVGNAFVNPYHRESGKKVKDAPGAKWIFLVGWIVIMFFIGSQL